MQQTNDTHIMAQNGQVIPVGEEQETEQLQDTALYQMLAPMRVNDAPIHLQAFDLLLDAEPEVKEQLAEVYFGEAMSLKKFLAEYPQEAANCPVLGMCFFEALPYKAKVEPHQMMPGYLQVRILTGIKEKGRYVVIKSSGKGIAQHVFYILKNRGWFLFDSVQTYRFAQNGETGAHSMYNIAHDLEKLLKKSQPVKK